MRPRLALLLGIVVALAAVAFATISEKRGRERDTRELAGAWRGGARVLVLGTDGQYWIAASASDGAISAAECGRWAAAENTATMRASWRAAPAGASDLVLLRDAGLHVATAHGDALSLVTPAPKSPRREELRRADPVAPPAGFPSACGVHPRDRSSMIGSPSGSSSRIESVFGVGGLET